METLPTTIEQILVVLAERFGTTVEALWEVLILQAYVTALGTVTLVVTLILLTIFLKKHTGWLIENADDAGAAVAAWLIMGAMWLIMVVAGLPSLYTQIINPQYWALEKILTLINGG